MKRSKLDKELVLIRYESQNALKLLQSEASKISKFPSLLLFDQYGTTTKAFLNEIKNYKGVDFLMFTASQSIKRFIKEKGIKENFSEEQKAHISASKSYDTHNALTEILRNQYTQLKLYPFTIQKNTNYYGLIFGTKHLRAVEKFLKVAWEMNPENGDANFTTDEEKGSQQMSLFQDHLTKVEKFQRDLINLIMQGKLKTNEQAGIYTFDQGFLLKYADAAIKNSTQIIYNGKSPKITYDAALGNKKTIVAYTVASSG